ncbi:MAG TPA: hypothetical protein VK557_05320, partial [Pyrinomonadaceae bacterium]|nr:hypothetical protein [Pyrinomonadaceae bacterium]
MIYTITMIYARKTLFLAATLVVLGLNWTASAQQVSGVRDFLGPRFGPSSQAARPARPAAIHNAGS